LRPFDLRGEHGLLANVRVEELPRIGEQQRDTVETAERLIGVIEEPLRAGADPQGRVSTTRILY
jgi:hypothetical protein